MGCKESRSFHLEKDVIMESYRQIMSHRFIEEDPSLSELSATINNKRYSEHIKCYLNYEVLF